jgi:hypothetical protein
MKWKIGQQSRLIQLENFILPTEPSLLEIEKFYHRLSSVGRCWSVLIGRRLICPPLPSPIGIITFSLFFLSHQFF